MSAAAEDVKSVFGRALELAEPAERTAFLDEACGGNAALRAEVEGLLSALDRAGGFLKRVPVADDGTKGSPSGSPATATFGSAPDAPTADFPGAKEHIGAILAGKYKLIEEIGEGGMGNVFLAQQTEPVKRAVAVKVIKAGMDSKGVLARFDAERQALAMMDHPNIARVLDAGTTEGGRPFFVMELVKGVPITEFCDARKLTPRQRLELFVPVCNAIQHAHQKGIIHRDIKPSNVLIALYDDKPVPKVIDFGVAKAAGSTLTDKTLMTGFGAVVGTPEYMSPEQASLNNLDIDTRSDVYSLGVLLYELLTGTTPVDRKSLGKAALLEVLRVVREVEAPKPSAKLSTDATLLSIAANRGTEPAKLSKLMKGELDWLVLKALDKDRSRRYATANGFAADVLRYLANETVLARPASTAYRFRKMWQRNKLPVTAAAAVAAALLIGIAFSTWQAVRADREATRADTEATLVTAALDELRATAPAFAEQARGLAAKEQFAEAIEKLDYAAKLQPDDADYPMAKGHLLQTQFRFAEAAVAYAAALEKRPGDARAEANLRLSEAMVAAPRAADGRLSREDLAKLLVGMQRDGRSAAELMPVSRLLGEEKKLLVDYWLQRLKVLPVTADQPLTKRLTVGEDGRLVLDLGGTKIADLSPLAGAPLASLALIGATEVTDIAALRGMALQSLNLSGTKVADLSPLADMRTLERLVLTSTPVTDLAPLRGLRLKVLVISSTPVSDIAALRGMPLEEFELGYTRVADLTPLAGMPLKRIDLYSAPVLDFSPLAGLPLEKCYLSNNRIRDLGVLRGLPLRELSLWRCVDARNYAALADIKTLELLLLPDAYNDLPAEDLEAIGRLRTHPKLRQLGAEIMNKMGIAATGPKEAFWRDWDRSEALFAAVRKSAYRFVTTKLPDGTYRLDVENQPLSDLSMLRGTPLSELWLNNCKVTDLSPLRGMPLKALGLSGNPVSDLTPLAGMPLTELALERTNVADLTPLKGMPLKQLTLNDCEKLTDVATVLTLASLEALTLPTGVEDIERFRNHPTLKLLAYTRTPDAPWRPAMTADQFWKEDGERNWIRALHQMGIKPRHLVQHGNGTWDLNLDETAIKDLTVLTGAKLRHLWLGSTSVADLSPLKGMPLKLLHLYRSKVTDLSPLKGMGLENLNLVATGVSDLSALRGMPLTSLRLHHCDRLTDLSALRDIKTLTLLTVPRQAKDFDFLRSYAGIERLSYNEDPAKGYQPSKTAAEFWTRADQIRDKVAAPKPPLPKEILLPAAARKRADEVVAVRITVASTGQSRDGRWHYFNSHADYRDPENFCVSLQDPVPDRLRELGLPEKHEEMIGKIMTATGKVGFHQFVPRVAVGEDDWVWVENAK